jgi:hypothetical protein
MQVPENFKAALRVDQLLSGDWDTVLRALQNGAVHSS